MPNSPTNYNSVKLHRNSTNVAKILLTTQFSADFSKESIYAFHMSVWQKIIATAGRVFEFHESETPLPPENGCKPDPDDLGFTAAIVCLSAKMAKADGFVTRDEVEIFTRVFIPPPEEAGNVRRVFDIARQSTAGFETYARRIGRRYRSRPCLLEDVLDGLFHIAGADGAVTEAELHFLRRVTELFGLNETEFRRIRYSHLGPDPGDPYAVLGLFPDAGDDEIRRAFRRLAAENHPDALAARGAPPEFLRIAHVKSASINEAYGRIQRERRAAAPSGADAVSA